MKLPPGDRLAVRVPWRRGPTDPVATRLIASIVRAAAPGTRRRALLDLVLRVPWHAVVAFGLFSLLLIDSVRAQNARGYPEAYLALLAIPLGAFLVRRPLPLGLVMAAAGLYLRALYLSYPETCDQLAVSRAALGIAVGGANPWGFGYPESVPPGAPYPYGPLAMVTSIAGVPGEVIAMGAMMVILASCRSLLTLAVLSTWVTSIELGICGVNDQVPALLLLAGLLLLERRRLVPGALLLAVSAGIKPYTFAWFPPFIAWGGVTVAVTLVVGAALAWLPIVAWGPASYLRSIEMAREIHPRPENTLNMPEFRILAVPIAAASLLVRSWTGAVLAGALIFLVVLFLDRWASFGYWYIVGPIVGVIAERGLRRFGARLRAAARGPGIAPGGEPALA